jgi:hypothetical protein
MSTISVSTTHDVESHESVQISASDSVTADDNSSSDSCRNCCSWPTSKADDQEQDGTRCTTRVKVQIASLIVSTALTIFVVLLQRQSEAQSDDIITELRELNKAQLEVQTSTSTSSASTMMLTRTNVDTLNETKRLVGINNMVSDGILRLNVKQVESQALSNQILSELSMQSGSSVNISHGILGLNSKQLESQALSNQILSELSLQSGSSVNISNGILGLKSKQLESQAPYVQNRLMHVQPRRQNATTISTYTVCCNGLRTLHLLRVQYVAVTLMTQCRPRTCIEYPAHRHPLLSL